MAGGVLCLLLFACSNDPAPPPPQKKKEEAVASTPLASAAPAVPRQAGARKASNGPRKVVETYYALIGSGSYADAFALREAAPGAPSLADFTAYFERYADYHVTIGTPSEPVESGDWLYVEVPVQPYGRTKAGSPIASAGMLTLRKPKQGGSWRIFTNA